jgi:hypothetical protein
VTSEYPRAYSALPAGQPCNYASAKGIRLLRTTRDKPDRPTIEWALRETEE